MVSDRNDDAGPPTSVERSRGIGLAQGEWLFAVQVLAGGGKCFHLSTMHRVRGSKDDRLNRPVAQNINEDPGNVIWGLRTRALAGRDTVIERIGEWKMRFPVGVFSQANPLTARKLYESVGFRRRTRVVELRKAR